jgi:hypothetical protein
MANKDGIQGRIDKQIVIKGLLEGKKYKDIAVEAGSLAKTDESKVTQIVQVIASNGLKAEIQPYIDQLKILRQQEIQALIRRDKDYVEYGQISASLDRTNKQVLLLGGEATEKIKISWE